MMCFPGSLLVILFGESRFYTGSTVELSPRVTRGVCEMERTGGKEKYAYKMQGGF